ncbi:MAG: hypothetical protein AAGG38_04755 [Planctomycetota bacterium]
MIRAFSYRLTVAVLLTASAAAPASAESTAYLVTGQLGAAASPTTLDRGGFSLSLIFDTPAAFDPALSNVGDTVLGFSTPRFALDLVPPAEVAAPLSFDGDTVPAASGFAVFTGDLTGFDTEQTTLYLGVTPEPSPSLETLSPTLIDLDFVSPGLAELFFTDRLTDLPPTFGLAAGSVRDPQSGQRVPVASATLAAISRDDTDALFGPGLAGGSSGGRAEPPAAVPTPAAAAGGLALLLGLTLRTGRRTRPTGDAARF